MADKETENKEDEKLTPVGDGIESTESDEKDKEESKKAAPEGDERAGHAEDDDDDDPDPELDDEATLRDKLRQQRRNQKKRRAARVQSDRRELEFLRRRNDQVERQLSQVVLRQEKSEVSSIDQRIGQLEGQIREAESIHTSAVDAKDGSTATEALRVKGELERTRDQLKSDRESRQKTAREAEERRQTAPVPDAEAVANGRDWVARNEWFDADLRDDDSYLARAIEERMAREGRLDPRDPEYWEELDRRIAKKLPHLSKGSKRGEEVKEDDDPRKVKWDDDGDPPARKKSDSSDKKKPSGPRISVGGRTRPLKSNEVYLSEQRIQALKEAGVYDDPEKLQRYLRAYKTYDEEARKNS